MDDGIIRESIKSAIWHSSEIILKMLLEHEMNNDWVESYEGKL